MIELHEVNKAYKGLKAVHELTLTIPQGQIYGLLGANGAGKSTTIQLLLGFLRPDTGRVRVNGFDPVVQATEARTHLGYIPENVQLYPYLSGLENLDYFCRLANLKYRPTELLNMLSTCGLQAEAHHAKVATYSKGMRQKVGIAIAYAKKAKVYLLDEPASGLDPVASNELSVLLKQLAADGAAILMASHDLFRVREVCHAIGMLKKGKLVKQLQSHEVSALELEQLYLDYMKN
jgi:ABC-2 type transport system ATP-binding protein